jgi:hypothetical protein
MVLAFLPMENCFLYFLIAVGVGQQELQMIPGG